MNTLMMFAAALSAALTPEAVAAWIDVLAHAFLVAIAVIGALLTCVSRQTTTTTPLSCSTSTCTSIASASKEIHP